MLKINYELKKYIELVAFDFTSLANENKELLTIEFQRREEVKTGIIALIKKYKNMPISSEENNLINYNLGNDYIHNDSLEGRIAILTSNISKKYWEKANLIRLKIEGDFRASKAKPKTIIQKRNYYINGRLEHEISEIKIYPYDNHLEYIRRLGEYREELIHAWAYHHSICFFNPIDGGEVKPRFDFDSDCFVEIEPSMSLVRKIANKIKSYRK